VSNWTSLRSVCAPRSRQPQRQFETLESRTLLSGTPPTVTDVHVASTQWSSAFYSYLQTHSQGDLGYRIPTGSTAQSKSLPWFNIDQLVLTFSEDVNVDSSDLSLSGVNATSFPVSHFFYDAIMHTATWTFAAPLTKNAYQVDLDGNGLDPVQDLDGNVLDGEWANNTATYASGNGIAGGDFAFSFKVLPGDANQNNGVEYYDYYASTTRQGLTTTSANYNAFADVDGSGAHESQDAQKIMSQLWATYPSGSPAGTNNDAPTTTGGTSIDIDNAALDVAISLYDTFQDAETPDSQLVYSIVSNSNASLFDTASINPTTKNLVLNAATGASGRSEIVVKATDAAGLSTTATFVVDVAYTNTAPTLNYTIVPSELEVDTFIVSGTVSDDGNVEGLLVEFFGRFNLRASVKADGSFSFAVVVYEENWGTEWARVADFQGLYSTTVERFVGMT
jgi:hypothetical protein